MNDLAMKVCHQTTGASMASSSKFKTIKRRSHELSELGIWKRVLCTSTDCLVKRNLSQMKIGVGISVTEFIEPLDGPFETNWIDPQLRRELHDRVAPCNPIWDG